MSDSIRAALERLVELDGLPDSWSPAGIQAWDDAIAAGKAALAEPESNGPAVPESREPASVIEEPSDEELLSLWGQAILGLAKGSTQAAVNLAFARAVLARWGNQPAPHDDRGVLPMVISDTGASDEPERERIICASISGGADYINKMPRMLILERIELHKGSICRRYIQEPTPPAEGEVAELMAWLRENAEEQ